MATHVIPPRGPRHEPPLIETDIDALILRAIARQRRSPEAYLSAGLIFTPCEDRLTSQPYRWAFEAWLADHGHYNADRDPEEGV